LLQKQEAEAKRREEEIKALVDQEKKRQEEEETRKRELEQRQREEEARKKIAEEETRREDAERIKRGKIDEQKRREDEQRKKVQTLALHEKQKAVEMGQQVQEKFKKEREEAEKKHRDQQKSAVDFAERMRREKEETFRKMEEDKKKREQFEMLRQEVEQGKHSGAPIHPVKHAIRPVQKPAFLPRIHPDLSQPESMPFQPETPLDQAVLYAYSTRPLPNPSLPKVSFSKKHDVYWLSQRRCEAELDHLGDVVVKLGVSSFEPFHSWIAQAERVEALKLKGMVAARSFISFQNVMS